MLIAKPDVVRKPPHKSPVYYVFFFFLMPHDINTKRSTSNLPSAFTKRRKRDLFTPGKLAPNCLLLYIMAHYLLLYKVNPTIRAIRVKLGQKSTTITTGSS